MAANLNDDPKRSDEEFHDEALSDPISAAPIMTEPTTFQDDAEDRRSQQQPQVDESRKLFQRLWTDEDEIGLLQGFLEYTNQRGQHHYDATLFYDQIKSKLQLEFNKNQLVEKLRRLKKKFRNVVNRINAGKDVAFKSPHDQATFEISRKIWSPNPSVGAVLDDEEKEASININVSPNPSYSFGNGNQSDMLSDERSIVKSRKRLRMKVEEHRDMDEKVGNVLPSCEAVPGPSTRVGTAIPNVIEQTVRSCLSPMFKEIMNSAANGYCEAGGIGVMSSPLAMSFGNAGNVMGGGVVDERWRRQQILELEVYSRRLELVQDEIKLQLHELRSSVS